MKACVEKKISKMGKHIGYKFDDISLTGMCGTQPGLHCFFISVVVIRSACTDGVYA